MVQCMKYHFGFVLNVKNFMWPKMRSLMYLGKGGGGGGFGNLSIFRL